MNKRQAKKWRKKHFVTITVPKPQPGTVAMLTLQPGVVSKNGRYYSSELLNEMLYGNKPYNDITDCPIFDKQGKLIGVAKDAFNND